jgi:hypothetical protein
VNVFFFSRVGLWTWFSFHLKSESSIWIQEEVVKQISIDMFSIISLVFMYLWFLDVNDAYVNLYNSHLYTHRMCMDCIKWAYVYVLWVTQNQPRMFNFYMHDQKSNFLLKWFIHHQGSRNVLSYLQTSNSSYSCCLSLFCECCKSEFILI